MKEKKERQQLNALAYSIAFVSRIKVTPMRARNVNTQSTTRKSHVYCVYTCADGESKMEMRGREGTK